MSFAAITNDNKSGDETRLRLIVEGWPDYFTTDAAFGENAAASFQITDGRTMIPGLLRDGIMIREELNLRQLDLQLHPITFRIRHDDAMASFITRAEVVDYLQANLSSSGASMTVTTEAKYTVDTHYHIGTEVVKTTDVASNPITIERRAWDTNTQRHHVRFGTIDEQFVAIYDRPPSMEGRRVRLDSESTRRKNALGQSTLETVWRGIVLEAPRLASDGLTWEVTAEPISAVLDQEIAALTDTSGRLRGVYHPYTHAFGYELIETTSVVPPNRVAHGPFNVTGFYETDEEFMEAVTDDMASNISLSGGSLATFALGRAGNGIYQLSMAFDDTNVPGSIINPSITSQLEGVSEGQRFRKVNDRNRLPAEPHLDQFAADEQWSIPLVSGEPSEGFPTLPLGIVRGAIGHVSVLQDGARGHLLVSHAHDRSAASSAPANRIHLDRNLGFKVGDHVEVLGCIMVRRSAAPHNLSRSIEEDVDISFEVTAIDPADPPSIQVDISHLGAGAAVFTQATRFQSSRTLGRDTHLGEAIAQLITESEAANEGGVPFVTLADFSGHSVDVAEAATLGIQRHRAYTFREPVTLSTWIRDELKILNMILFTHAPTAPQPAANGAKLGLRPLLAPSRSQSVVATIDGSHIVTPYGQQGSWIRWEPNRDGIVNTAIWSTGYNPAENDHEGRRVIARDVESISTHKNRSSGVQYIEPKSRAAFDDEQRLIEEAIAISQQYFAFFGRDYDVVTLDVTCRLFDLLIGDHVELSHSLIPNSATGRRGVTNARGVVIGREWNLDPQEPMQGRLTILVHRDELAGYAPTCKITGATNVSGNTWNLTVEANEYTLAAQTLSDTGHFDYGDYIRVREHHKDVPGEQTGRVTTVVTTSAITETNIQVDLDGTAPWGGSYGAGDDYRLIFDRATETGDNNTMDSQNKYVYVADEQLDLYDDSSARLFA